MFLMIVGIQTTATSLNISCHSDGDAMSLCEAGH